MSATANQAAVRTLATSTARAAVESWRQVDQTAVSASWTAALPSLVARVTTAQIAAAALARQLVTAAAGAGAATVNPAAFAGVASDGRSLVGLLFQPAITVMLLLAAGNSPGRSLFAGLAQLDMIVRTQIADANRTATGVAMAADPRIIGYERVVHLPACGRCLVLAGRLYRWSDGFARHPRCDCTMRPVTRAQHRDTELDNHPRALFDRMTREQQDAKLGKAAAAAIRDGADISQVVNARRGMTAAGTTTTGATRRGTAGRRLAGAARLTPERIYQLAGNRDEAVELLRQHGYVL